MVAVGVTFLVAFAASVLAVPIGRRLGIVDQPDDRLLKVHQYPAVPLGGLGVFAAVTIGMTLGGVFDPGLAIAGGLLLLVGLFDDLMGLPPLVRLVAQIAVAWLLATAADLPPGYETVGGAVFVVLLVVVAVNAVNLFDGLDGLAATGGIVAAIGIALVGSTDSGLRLFGAVLAAGLLGFLVLNRPPARVFLGDNGAYVVGLFLAYGILLSSDGPEWAGVPALLLMGVFALDLAATIIRRAMGRVPLFSGDRRHLYDQLCDRGMSVVGVSIVAASVQAGFVIAALALLPLDSQVVQVGSVVVISAGALLLVGWGGFLTPGDS